MVTENADTAPALDLPNGPPPAPRDITFLPDPLVDHLLRAVVTLTMELSVTRERLRAVENVVGEDVAARIDALVPDEQEDAARRAARDALVHSILGPMVNHLSGKD